MVRKAYKEILDWHKKASRKPLILMGARQVGKTWLMEEFARNEYAGNTVAVNLMKNESLRLRFDTLNLDSDSVIDAFQLATGAVKYFTATMSRSVRMRERANA